MSKRHPIDDLFRRGLDQHPSAVPADMFDRIAASRRSTSGSPVVPVWLMAAMLGAVILAGTFWLGYQQGQQATVALSHFPVQPTPATQSLTPNPDAITSTATVATPTDNTNQNSQLSSDLLASLPAAPQHPTTAADPIPAKPSTAVKVAATSPTDQVTEVVTNDLPAFAENTTTVQGKHQLAILTDLPVCDFLAVTSEDYTTRFGNNARSPRCAKFTNRDWRYDLDILAGPTYGLHTLRARNFETSEHLKRRENTETPVVAYGITGRIAALSPSGIAIRTGLSYTQVTSRFEYHNENETIIRYIDELGPDGEVIRTDTVFQAGARHMVDHNDYRFLDVPVQLGYEFTYGKLKVGVNAGASLNLGFTAQGTFLSPSTGEPTAFSNDVDRPNSVPAYRAHIGAGLEGSLTFRYHLRGRYSLIAEPYLRHYTGSLTKAAYSLDQRTTITGLNLGLRMRL